MSNASLTALLEPLLSEELKRELRVRQAFEEGVIDETERFTLETTIGRRERLVAQAELAVAAEQLALAAELQAQLQAETRFLDEMLDSLPRPAFASAAVRRRT